MEKVDNEEGNFSFKTENVEVKYEEADEEKVLVENHYTEIKRKSNEGNSLIKTKDEETDEGDESLENHYVDVKEDENEERNSCFKTEKIDIKYEELLAEKNYTEKKKEDNGKWDKSLHFLNGLNNTEEVTTTILSGASNNTCDKCKDKLPCERCKTYPTNHHLFSSHVCCGKKFYKCSYEEKIELKNKGRPLPDIAIEIAGISRGKSYKRQFKKEIYSRNGWICGCSRKNALFCFPCLLYGGDKSWTQTGVTDLEHLSEKIRRHDNSKHHIHNCMELAILGTTDIRTQLDSAYWVNVQNHNETVTKNRIVLSKIIDRIKFGRVFESALRGHDETENSQNPGTFHGLINWSAELDATLNEHLQNASVFKGHLKEIQNDLLDCILEVCHEEIINEVKKTSFIAVIVDETTEVSAKSQFVMILRYTLNGEPIERFWKYLNPTKCDAETVSENILSVLDPLLENAPYKLISQSYDGGAVMTGQHAGVQAKIKQKYPFAHFVHCYAHQLNLIVSKATSKNYQVRVFFGNLKEIPAFFNNSPQRIEVLNTVVGRKTPLGATARWNFNIRTINVVFENKDSLIECMEEIEEQFNNETICSAASSIRRMLEDSVFVFWLTFFHHAMPPVDILFDQLQKRKTDTTQENDAINNFEYAITHVRNNIDDIVMEVEPQGKKRKRSHNSTFDHRVAALEVCDLIKTAAKDRFAFKDHLLAASLLFSENFGGYCGKFPDEKLDTTCLAYPTLDKKRLKTELSVIYFRNDCRGLHGALPLLKFLKQNHLGDTLREVKKLLEIVVTTPILTSDAERCFSTSKRIKTFLRNLMSQDHLTALSMISVEKLFISKIDNFNEKVIDKFACRKDYGIELILK